MQEIPQTQPTTEPQTANTEAPTTPPQIPSPKKNFPLIIVFSVLFLGLIGGMAYFVNQNNLLREQISSIQEAVDTETPNQATLDSAEEWVTYTNNTIGFSLEHPPEFSSKEITDLGPNSQRVAFNSNTEISIINISTSPVGKLPQYPFDQKPTGDYELANIKGIYQELPNGYGDGISNGPPPPLLSIYAVKGGRLFSVDFYGISDIQNETVVQILSTFKFAGEDESATDDSTVNLTENWKAYRDEEHKFEFMYPEDGTLESTNQSANRNRIQNYSPLEDRYGLNRGEYYIEIFLPIETPCKDNVSKASITHQEQGTIYNGIGLPGGEAEGTRFIICAEINDGPNLTIQVTENDESGTIAKEVLSTFKFIN